MNSNKHDTMDKMKSISWRIFRHIMHAKRSYVQEVTALTRMQHADDLRKDGRFQNLTEKFRKGEGFGIWSLDLLEARKWCKTLIYT